MDWQEKCEDILERSATQKTILDRIFLFVARLLALAKCKSCHYSFASIETPPRFGLQILFLKEACSSDF